jgi:Leucine-rich repeat (LRR) protein
LQPTPAPTKPEQPITQPTPAPTKPEKPVSQPTPAPTKPENPLLKPTPAPSKPDKPVLQPTPAPPQPEKPLTQPTPAPTKPDTPPVSPTPVSPKLETPVASQASVDSVGNTKEVIELIKKLGGSYKLSPNGVLTTINVDGAAMTADMFDVFAKQTELDTLQVANFRGLNDKVFSKILGLKKLKTLSITNSIITDISVDAIVKSFPSLRNLDLSRNASLTDDSLFHIGKLNELESLVVNYCTFSEFGLMNLEKLPKLRALDIRGNVKISASGLGIIAKIPSLRSLKHMSNTVDDMALAELSAAKNLDTLDMYDFAITDVAGEELKKLPKLTSLVIFRCLNFGSQGLLALKGKPLKRLTLRDLTSLDDVGMEAFREFTTLRRLYLHELNSITDVGMMNLVYLKDLELLDIWSVPSITDKSIESIAKLPNLKSISIRSTKITDKSVDLLLTIPKLEELILTDNASITEAAKAKLKDSKKFKSLTLDSAQK